MSEASVAARKAAKEKVARITRADPKARVDASDYRVPDELMPDVQTGMRPISKRQFACGGAAATHHGGRKARKAGGATECADAKANLDMKEANRERDGEKHIGGMKKGGRAKRDSGGMTQPPPSINVPTTGIYGAGFGANKPGLLAQVAAKRGGKMRKAKRGECAEVSGTRPTGGRIARSDGGKAGKGKMNVNIIIGEKPPASMAPAGGPPPPAPRPLPPPPMTPQGMPPASMGGPPPMPGPMPPPQMPPPRASGGMLG